jgi:type IV secretion system protein VirB5
MNWKRAIAYSIVLFSPIAVRAQVTVFDPAAAISAAQQYAQMIEEFKLLQQQLDEARESLVVSKDQLEAIGSGASNIGKDNFEDYTKDIPTDWKATLNAMRGSGTASSTAVAIRDEASLLNQAYFDEVPEDIKSDLGAMMDGEATNQALNSAIFDASGERFRRLEDLRSRIDGAHDLKTISDLQARIQIENGMLMNELVKLQSLNQVTDSNRRVKSETSRQRKFEMTSAKY